MFELSLSLFRRRSRRRANAVSAHGAERCARRREPWVASHPLGSPLKQNHFSMLTDAVFRRKRERSKSGRENAPDETLETRMTTCWLRDAAGGTTPRAPSGARCLDGKTRRRFVRTNSGWRLLPTMLCGSTVETRRARHDYARGAGLMCVLTSPSCPRKNTSAEHRNNLTLTAENASTESRKKDA